MLRLLLFLLLPSSLAAQEVIRLQHFCAYRNENVLSEYYQWRASTEADTIVSEICRAVSLSKNFIVRSSNVENAMALLDATGERVILYSTVFLDKFKQDAHTRWAAYSVLAHEVGHHLNAHRFDEKDPARRRILELQADEFSGGVLRLLGATMEEAKAGIELFAEEGESNRYPSGRARREAVARGWKEQDERLNKIVGGGIGPIVRPPVGPDRDGDGVPDATDKCPDEYGLPALDGCPDADGDGLPDHADQCKYQPGPAKWQGCPDTDGDGVPDHEDDCPTQPGPPERKGCPLADRDGDGVPDQSDKCPDKPGLKQFQGCPDTDGDGVPDHEDDCPTVAGLPALRGCPEKPAAPAKPRAGEVATDGLVFVSGGTFTMGCTSEQGGECDTDEKPTRQVTVSDFYLGKYEVTQKQWRDVMGSDPPELWNKGCDNCPVERVSWNDIQDFLKKLNAANPGKNYRLPTEAEWEYAARGGSLSRGYKYAGSNNLDEVAWYTSNSGGKTRPVGGKKANELGLHDMSGNVWEWCSDWWGNYPAAAQTNPTGPGSGGGRVLRGGSWFIDARNCRVAYRYYNAPTNRFSYLGFRLCRSF